MLSNYIVLAIRLNLFKQTLIPISFFFLYIYIYIYFIYEQGFFWMVKRKLTLNPQFFYYYYL
jgi:hypothetical protein